MPEPEHSQENSPTPGPPERNVAEMRAQLGLLEHKLLESKEPVVREALQMRISQLMTELGADMVVRQAPKPKQATSEEPVPPPPTAEQQLAADDLIRRAQVAKMRGQVQEATTLIEQAAAIAPGAANVLELLGDELVERKKYGEARAAYGRAHKADPANVAIERKFAEMVLRTTAGMSMEVALTMGDSPFLNPGETTASAWAATVFSLLVPGSGQLVLGETKKGLALIGAWILCLITVGLMQTDMQGLVQSIGGRHGNYSVLIFLPLIVLFGIYAGAIGGCSTKVKKRWVPPARSAEKPTPPVNLPFE